MTWEERWSNSRNRPYYYNRSTGESLWDKPDDRQDKVHCLHILVKHAGSRRPSSHRLANITRSEQEAQVMLIDALQDINNVDDFRKKASELSDCSSASKNGDLGWFSKGDMQVEFESAAFSLRPGEMTREPVRTDSGYHLIWRVA
jgi:peptidyl-prolyl cis-trans isomerase NIMA-interacting 1